jgi:hypothetical protein
MWNMMDIPKIDSRDGITQGDLISSWPIPVEVKIKNDELLVWRFGKSSDWVKPSSNKFLDLLHQFLNLKELWEIRDFAREWGALGICKHGLPASHIPQLLADKNYTNLEYCRPLQRDDGAFYEPIERWRYFVRAANETQKMRYTVVESEERKIIRESRRSVFEPKDWPVLGSWLATQEDLLNEALGYKHLSFITNKWFQLTGVYPEVHWRTSSGTAFVLSSAESYSKLLGAIAVQLMLSVNQHMEHSDKRERWGVCSNCGTPFSLRPGQSLRRNRYCDLCNKWGAWRNASAKYRRKERENPSRKKRAKKKLTDDQIIEIQQHCEPYCRTGSCRFPSGFVNRLAIKYGVSKSRIYKIAERNVREKLR